MTTTLPSQTSDSQLDNAQGNFVYLGSQYPPDVHGFRFTETVAGTPISLSCPYKAANYV